MARQRLSIGLPSDPVWELDLPPAQKLALLAIRQLNEAGTAFSIAGLARFLRVDRKTMYRTMYRLASDGLITWGYPPARGPQSRAQVSVHLSAS